MDAGSSFSEAATSITRFFTRKRRSIVPPRLSNPVRYPFGEFEMRIHASPGQELQVSSTRDLKHWEPLETISAAREATVYSDQKAGRAAALFYRVASGAFMSNMLGFISVEIPPGYSMLANPLRGTASEVSALLPSMPEETTLSKFSLVTFSLSKNTFGPKGWSNPSETLTLGEGALIFNPADTSLTARFVGEVSAEHNTLPIHSGTTIRGSMLPLAGRLDADLAFPIGEGDVVSIYSNHNEKYREYRYGAAGWDGDPPLLRLGEAFWIAKNTSAVWTQRLPA